MWVRFARTVTVASRLHIDYVHKLTLQYEIKITGFYGSASLNIQPILLNSLVSSEDWIAVVRDKVLRYYHLVRPLKPESKLPAPETAGDKQRGKESLYSFLLSAAARLHSPAAGHGLGSTTGSG